MQVWHVGVLRFGHRGARGVTWGSAKDSKSNDSYVADIGGHVSVTSYFFERLNRFNKTSPTLPFLQKK